MSSTTMIVLNVVMSVLAFAAVAAGVAIGYRLRSAGDGRRATWRGPVPGRLVAISRRPYFLRALSG